MFLLDRASVWVGGCVWEAERGDYNKGENTGLVRTNLSLSNAI